MLYFAFHISSHQNFILVSLLNAKSQMFTIYKGFMNASTMLSNITFVHSVMDLEKEKNTYLFSIGLKRCRSSKTRATYSVDQRYFHWCKRKFWKALCTLSMNFVSLNKNMIRFKFLFILRRTLILGSSLLQSI